MRHVISDPALGYILPRSRFTPPQPLLQPLTPSQQHTSIHFHTNNSSITPSILQHTSTNMADKIHDQMEAGTAKENVPTMTNPMDNIHGTTEDISNKASGYKVSLQNHSSLIYPSLSQLPVTYGLSTKRRTFLPRNPGRFRSCIHPLLAISLYALVLIIALH